MGYGIVWDWEQSNHCAEWIRRGSRDEDREDAGQPSELEVKQRDREMECKIFSVFLLPTIPSLNTFSLQLKSGGLCKGLYTYFIYSLPTSHMYFGHLILSTFYHKPLHHIAQSAFPALSEALIEARALVSPSLAHTLGTRRL
jgi:hypothetical protein